MYQKLFLMLLVSTALTSPVLAVEETTLPPVAPPPLIDDVGKAGVIVAPPPSEELDDVQHESLQQPPIVEKTPTTEQVPTSAAAVVAPLVGDPAPITNEPSPTENAPDSMDKPPAQKTVHRKKTTHKKGPAPFVYPKTANTRVIKDSTPHSPVITQQAAADLANNPTPMESDAMPFSAVLREAYLFNPDLRSMRAATKAVFEQLPQATSYLQPQINATGDVTYSNTTTDTSVHSKGTEKTIGLNLEQPLYRGGRTIAQIRMADARIDAQLATLADTERTILFNAAQAYMDVLKSSATVRVNEKNRDVIARQLQATKDRFRVGDVTRTDVAQSEFRLAQAEADLTSATGAYRSARAVFEQIVGVPAPDHLDVPESLFVLPDTQDAAITASELYHPGVIAAKARERAARSNIDVETGALLPDVSLNAGVSATRGAITSSYDESDTGRVGVSLSMPLYEGGATRSRVRAAKYTANELYLKILSARRAAREETVRAFENLAAARAEYRSRQSQVHAATIARDGVRQEAELGQRTILDALDADLELRDAEIAEITAQRNQVVAEFALASAIGQLVPGNVGIEEQVFDPNDIRHRALTSVLSTDIEKEPEDGR